MGVAFPVGGFSFWFGRNANTGGDIGAGARLVPALGDRLPREQDLRWNDGAWG